MTGGSVIASMIAVVAVVAVIRAIYADGSKTKSQRAGRTLASIVGGFVVQAIVSFGLNHVGKLHNAQVEVGQLRMVIFAMTLIVLMLLRPQGVFAHHEFSWDWVSKLLKGKKGAAA